MSVAGEVSPHFAAKLQFLFHISKNIAVFLKEKRSAEMTDHLSLIVLLILKIPYSLMTLRPLMTYTPLGNVRKASLSVVFLRIRRPSIL